MGARRIPISIALGLALAVVLASGCTNSEKLSSGVGPQVVEVLISEQGTRFNIVEYQISEIRIEPDPVLNPEAATVQEAPLLLIRGETRIQVDQAVTPPRFTTNVPLTAGAYLITRVTLRDINMTDGVSADDGTCTGSITSFTGTTGLPFSSMTGPFEIFITERAELQSVADSPQTFTLEINGTNFVNAFVANWVLCRDPAFPPFINLPINCALLDPGPCTPIEAAGNFNATGFVDAATNGPDRWLLFPSSTP